MRGWGGCKVPVGCRCGCVGLGGRGIEQFGGGRGTNVHLR